MKMHVIQNKNETMVNVNVNVKNQLTGGLVKRATCGILVHAITVGEYLDTNNSACKERVIDIFVLSDSCHFH